MKKLLGISLAAVLAVAPSFARADDPVAPAAPVVTGARSITKVSASDPTTNTNIATTSYVLGAYKATGDKIDALIDDTAVTSNGHYIEAEKTVSHNLSKLDTAVKANEDHIGSLNSLANTFTGEQRNNLVNAINTVASQASAAYQLKTASEVVDDGEGDLHYITAGQGVGANLKSLDDHVYANTTEIGTFNTNGNHNYVQDSNTVQQNLQALDGQVKINTDEIGTYNSSASHTYVTDNQTVHQNLQALDAQVTTNTGKIGTLADGNYTDGTTVAGDISALDTQVKANADAISTLSATMTDDFATKEGVVATINKSTASGTVAVFGDWNSGNSTGSITVNSNVTSPATNAYYATLGAQSGTQQTDSTPVQEP